MADRSVGPTFGRNGRQECRPYLGNDRFMAYEANTPDDLRVMLDAIGVASLDDLFKMIPAGLRTKGPLAIPPALSELELTTQVSEALAQNQGADQKVCFLGGGAYDHFIPAVVDNIAGRGEFYTAYTPYQAEASQGTLQATFEYQTLMTQLTGLDVSNASLYDGGSAAAEAMLMALATTNASARSSSPGRFIPRPGKFWRHSWNTLSLSSSPSRPAKGVSLPIAWRRSSPIRLPP